jgi:phosphohistidine phosphatase
VSARSERAGEAGATGLRLYLFRHADAGDPAAWTKPDAERPLSAKGRRQAAWVGRWLRRQGRVPDVVVTSPKARATETATIATEGWKHQPIVDERLAAGAGIAEVEAILAEHGSGAGRVMLVGHDPDFSDLASELVGAAIALKKGAVARIDVSGPLAAGAGTLRWLVPPEAVADD